MGNILKGQKNIPTFLTGRKKIILPSFLIILFGISVNNVSALSYQNSVDLSFTFNPVLAISLSSADLLIPNLTPGSSAYSNTITIGVDTNNIAGYTLSAKIGDGTTYTNDKLINSSSNTYFDNLTSSSTLSNFGDNKWGYALGTISSSSTYSGLVYNNDTIINATTNASGTAATGYTGTSNTSFTIAAKASDTQSSGDYKNVIIFTVVANTTTMSINNLNYMQDFAGLTSSQKNEVIASMTTGTAYTLTDSRDGEDYYIAKLADDNVWMLDNLRLGGDSPIVLTNEDSNISSASWTLPASSEFNAGSGPKKVDTATSTRSSIVRLAFYGPQKENTNKEIKLASAEPGSCSAAPTRCSVPSLYADNKNTVVTYYGASSGKSGVYYNYCAASAGTLCTATDDDNTDIVYDICPASWRLPTGTSSGEYELLYTSYNSIENDFRASFSPSLAGAVPGYSYAINNQNNTACYWTSMHRTGALGDRAVVTVSSNSTNTTSYAYRANSFSVRCILNN
jgi:hypothetical protein